MQNLKRFTKENKILKLETWVIYICIYIALLKVHF